jgi:chemotaxis-related protein WspD
VLGLVNVRGELLICVSLGHLLGLARSPLRETARTIYDRLLVAKWQGHRFVFPADEVRGIHRFQTPELQEPPATLVKSRLSYTQGILYWQGRTVGLLDADLLFSSLNRSLT